MNNLTLTFSKSLVAIIEQYGNRDIIVAYSGGVDSQVLLHALMQLKQSQLILNNITVCHVNHGLSDNADYWQDFATKECQKLSVKLVVKSVDVKATPQKSLEALARDARYAALKLLSDKPLLVLTGHHSDDQSETFLLALKRGAGLKGLSAMSATTTLGQHTLVRPLLEVSRHDIEVYAKQHGLNWIEDESNSDTSFDRNFIRQEVVPLLRERWPSINNTINRSASHCADGQELLDELAEQDLADSLVVSEVVSEVVSDVVSQSAESSLAIEPLKKLSSARFNNLIRFYMAKHHCLMPSTEQLNQLSTQLLAADDKSPQVKVGTHFFRRFKGQLYLTADYQDLSEWQANIELYNDSGLVDESRLTLPDNLGELIFLNNNTVEAQLPAIALPSKAQKVTIRFSHANPTCLPHFRQRSRAVKKVLQELAIAPWQRKRIAFLYYDEELVAAIGHFVCQPFIATDNQASITVTHTRK